MTARWNDLLLIQRLSKPVTLRLKLTALFTLIVSVCLLAGCAEPVDAPIAAPSPTPTLQLAPTPTLAPTPIDTPSPTTTRQPPPTATPTATPPAPTASASLPALRAERAFPNLDFRRLTNLVQPPDAPDLFFATEQAGLVRVFSNNPDATEAAIFLDIRDRVSEENNEEGLLGLAFDPEYAANGHFYVYYSAASPRRSVVSRFTAVKDTPKVADPDSELVVMEIPQPYGNHNGGQLAFGPDGYLYIGLGDGGSGGDPKGNGQNPGTLLGSILRIDVGDATPDLPYVIPRDNPFAGVDEARGEIWAYGLRNPWRFSFDRETGDLWTGDVGQNQLEEVDLITRGLNYGWNVMEGSQCFSPRTGCDPSGLEPPVAEYGRSDGCSVTGGYVYRGGQIPALEGAYLYADYCSGRIWGLRYDGSSVTEQALLADTDLLITSFGEDSEGNLYVLSRNEGIYRLLPA